MGSCTCNPAARSGNNGQCLGTCTPRGGCDWEARLLAFQKCEGWCGETLPSCAPYKCGEEVGMLVEGVRLAGEIDCALFGPHVNAERRNSDLSPQDVQAIIEEFSVENSVDIPLYDLSSIFGPNWYGGALGSLGVSHNFHLMMLECYLDDGLGGLVLVQVKGWGVAGEMGTCSVIPGTSSYEWKLQRRCEPEPGWEFTDGRQRAAQPPGNPTPASGAELFFVKLDPLPLGYSPDHLTATIVRDDWLKVVSPFITKANNRKKRSDVATVIPDYWLRRVQPGNILEP